MPRELQNGDCAYANGFTVRSSPSAQGDVPLSFNSLLRTEQIAGLCHGNFRMVIMLTLTDFLTKNFCVLHNTVEHNYISPSSTVGIQLHVSALYVGHLQAVN